MTPRWRSVSTWLGLLVLVHVVWGIVRVPGKVWQRRLDDVDAYRRGPVNWFLGPGAETRLGGADAVQWLLDNTPPACVVPWRGEAKGAFELASGLLAPRWLVHADAVPRGAREYLGRALAAGSEGVVVLVGRGEDVTLEAR